MAIKVETKVGAFFLIGLAIFVFFTFKVGDFGSLMHRRMTMTTTFPHAGGLNEGDGVHVAGVKVGEISRIELNDNGVKVVMDVDAHVTIRESSVATVAWGGLIGNRYVDISLGNPEDPALPPGSEILSKPSIELGAVLEKINNAAESFKEMLASGNIGPKLTDLVDNLLVISQDIQQQKGTVGKLVGSDELYNKVVGIADDLKAASSRISAILKENDSRIASILEGLDEAAPEAREAFAAIRRIGEKLESGEGVLPALINDEAMYKDLKESLASLRASLDRVDNLTASFKEGDGLIARLANDGELADDFAQAVKSFRTLAERLEYGDNTFARLTQDPELYDEVKKLLNEARETLRSVKDQVPVGTFASVMLSAF